MIGWIISSSVLILVIILIRRILRGRMSLRLQYALWALVLIRLLLPFSLFESSFSIMNLANKAPGMELMETAGELQGMEEIEFTPIEPTISTTATDLAPIAPPSFGNVSGYYPGDSDHAFPTQIMNNATVEEFQQLEKAIKAQDILIPIWLIGSAIMAAYFLFTNLRFAGALRRSRREKEIPGSIIPVYVSEIIPTPCLFGIFRPAVYVTPDCEKDLGTLRHVLAHETTHYRHGDNIWAVLRCLALAVHWYNPFVWWAAVLSKRDGELACDEGAIRRLGENERAPYGRTLIGMTCQRNDLGALAHTATTMTGSKKSIKERVMLIAKKPKMAVYTLVAVILIAAAAVGCTFSGASSGFTDREARREALPLAETTAFQNGLELEGKGIVSRDNGYILEAGDGLRQQYVSVKFALKNSPFHIVVDFAMLDEKGQSYGEPFSASIYISRASMPIIEEISSVESVELWKIGYENPIVPTNNEQEILDYLAQFEYGDYIRHQSEISEGFNDEGFVVYFSDGSSLTIGLDAAERHHVVRPEMESWLEEIFESAKFPIDIPDDFISVDKDIISSTIEYSIIQLALERVEKDIIHYEQVGTHIIDAKLTGLTQIPTGTVDQYGNGINMYLMEYRLLPEDVDSVMMVGGIKIEDGWITESGSGGQPLLMCYMADGMFAGYPGHTSTNRVEEEYVGEGLREKYEDAYTAACMEYYKKLVSEKEYDYYVLIQTGGTGIPPHYHLKYERTWTEDGWISADGKPLNILDANIPTISIADHPGTLPGYVELDIHYNSFITRSGINIYRENLEIVNYNNTNFYDADDLYALDPGSYYVTFDIVVPHRYIEEEDMWEESCYSCVFRLEVTPNEEGTFYFTGDAESLVELYAREVHAKEMLAVEGDYAITDYKLVSCDVYAERVDGAVIIGEMHYAISPVNWNFPDWWAGSGMEEGEGEYEGMWIRHNQFTLEARGDGFWKCTGLATGGGGGWGFINNHTAEEAKAFAIDFLESGAADTSLVLSYLPLINFADIDTDDFFDLMNATEEVCVGEGIVYGPEQWRTWADVYPDDQFYRNMYCMKAALNTDGAHGARMQYILSKQMHHDEELFARCLQYFSLEEQDILMSLADDDFV